MEGDLIIEPKSEHEISWYANSWGKTFKTSDVPCFWSKNQRKDDPQTADYEANHKRGLDVMLIYSELPKGRVRRRKALVDALNSFLARAPIGKVDVWLQGTFEGMNPRAQVKWLASLPRRTNLHILDDSKMRHIILRTVLGLLVISPRNTDVDAGGVLMMKKHSSVMYLNDGDVKDLVRKTSKSAARSYIEMCTQLLIQDADYKVSRDTHDPAPVILRSFDTIMDIPHIPPESHDFRGQAQKTNSILLTTRLSQMSFVTGVLFRSKRSIKDVSPDNADEIFRAQEDLIREAKHHRVTIISDGMDVAPGFYLVAKGLTCDRVYGTEQSMLGHVRDVNSFNIYKSQSMSQRYARLRPQRINVVLHRPTSYGMRVIPGALPQMFPVPVNTRDILSNAPKLDNNVFYMNYIDHAYIHTCSTSSELGYEFVPGKGFRLVRRSIGSVLYDIGPYEYFMGLGFPVISAHSSFGVQRDPLNLLRIEERRKTTQSGTSGHMISATLAHDSHFHWYLEEVHKNHSTKTSIYLFPFIDPNDTAYHTLEEYKHAIEDLKAENAQRGLPLYVRQRIPYLEVFVTALRQISDDSSA
jgi:hypothetical protein